MGIGKCQREVPVGSLLRCSQHIEFGEAAKPGAKTQTHGVSEIVLRFSFGGEAFQIIGRQHPSLSDAIDSDSPSATGGRSPSKRTYDCDGRHRHCDPDNTAAARQ